MTISTRKKLKLSHRQSAWAWQELTFDQKMQEMNRLTSRGRKRVLRYLESVHGSPQSLLIAAGSHLKRTGIRAKLVSGLEAIETEFPWLFEEMLYEQKRQEARELWGSLGTMYRYLKACYGSTAEVLRSLRWIVTVQGRRAKTLCL